MQALEHSLGSAGLDIVATAPGVGIIGVTLAVMRGKVPASDLPAWLVVHAAVKAPLVWFGRQRSDKIDGIIAVVNVVVLVV